VIYARQGVASFWSATVAGAEEWLWLDAEAVRRDAPAAIWEVTGVTLREQGDAVEVVGTTGAPAIRVVAPAALARGGRPVGARLAASETQIELWLNAEGEEVLVDPGWIALKHPMGAARASHTATELRDGRVLVVGGAVPDTQGVPRGLARAEIFDPRARTWTPVAPPSTARGFHTATLLWDGRVLVAGGSSDGSSALDSVEIFDPSFPLQPWTQAPSLTTPRAQHTATLLGAGGVLVAGGGADASAEIFDPRSPSPHWTPTPPMSSPRQGHTATLLPSGGVLVAGGAADSMTLLDSAEIFDALSQSWAATAAPSTARVLAAAVLLPNGQVLIAGGAADASTLLPIATAEIFDPIAPAWAPAPPMGTVRIGHTATALPNGQVLIASGDDDTGTLDSAESFDPSSQRWTALPRLSTSRADHSATPLSDGRVLVAGGHGETSPLTGIALPLDSAELFDPSAPGWSPAGSMASPREGHTATLLADGAVLVAGGSPAQLDISCGASPLNSTDTFRPTSPSPGFRSAPPMNIPRANHVAAQLPDGRVLVAGGYSDSAETVSASAETFDATVPAWTSAVSMSTPRVGGAVLSLLDGRILATGGIDDGGQTLASAEIFDPSSGSWAAVAPMSAVRAGHTSTLLSDGRVLVAGGDPSMGAPSSLDSVEVFDPTSSTWEAVPPMSSGRSGHSATLLLDGRVLVVGGNDGPFTVASAEVFDPPSLTWTPTDRMSEFRSSHTATLLLDGRVLVAGGSRTSASAEVLDPSSLSWSPAAPLSGPRSNHTATRLLDGRVLVAGGDDGTNFLATAEIFSLQPNGTGCGAPRDCLSGFCVDGVCCDRACNAHLCEACSEARDASADGTCTPLVQCSPFACSPVTGRCVDACRTIRDCAPGYACDPSGSCVPAQPSAYLDDGRCDLAAPGLASSGGSVSLAVALAALRRRRRLSSPGPCR
jgi:hypothetical protein